MDSSHDLCGEIVISFGGVFLVVLVKQFPEHFAKLVARFGFFIDFVDPRLLYWVDRSNRFEYKHVNSALLKLTL